MRRPRRAPPGPPGAGRSTRGNPPPAAGRGRGSFMDRPDSGTQDQTVAAARLHVVLVEPEIAANTGAIGRTCVAAGAMLWLVRPLGFHLDDRHRRRAGLDYSPHLLWRAVDHLDDVLAALGPDRLWSFSTKARQPYTQAVYRESDALVFGAESRGLPASWLEARPDRALTIPI